MARFSQRQSTRFLSLMSLLALNAGAEELIVVDRGYSVWCGKQDRM